MRLPASRFHVRPRIAPVVVVLSLWATLTAAAQPSASSAAEAYVPRQAPRTGILVGRSEAFRAYVTSGAGAAAFARIKEDFDRDYLKLPFPAEPLTYGDPSPRLRDSDKADRWREAQDVCGLVSGVAEAGAMIWRVTGDPRYLEKSKQFLLGACRWSLDASGWKQGPVTGATDIEYNDEAHFRLWRKLPLVYDQIRAQLSPDERAAVLAHFRQRGRRSAAWIEKQGRVSQTKRNSIEIEPSSHPIRFMPMTGLAGLALWDDLPEAHRWWASAYTYYRDQFPPWGGDDGGWAEGPAYWRGNMEHAAFQDTLLAIGDPSAYTTAFWKNHAYFQVYNVQPYLASGFGDFSNAGRFNLEPVVAEYLLHVARVTQDGYLRSFAELCTDERPSPAEKGLRGLDRIYPTSAEFLVRNFIASALPVPPPQPLSELPKERYFRDVGWVSLHSALGRPADDIHITFVSSPYGSFSHSHAHQNAFVLNAYGQNLAIASGYREFHNSPHHEKWTRQTLSKNALLIDGRGQKSSDARARGKITQFSRLPRAVWTQGDATEAYQTLQPAGRLERATRDLVFVDHRYLVIRDVVTLKTPGKISWLLHGEHPVVWDEATQTARILQRDATLTTRLIATGQQTWRITQTDRFTTPVDPKYVKGGASNFSTSSPYAEQGHLSAETSQAAREHVIYAVLWPERSSRPPDLTATASGSTLTVTRPDGGTDRITFSDTSVQVQ